MKNLVNQYRGKNDRRDDNSDSRKQRPKHRRDGDGQYRGEDKRSK